MFRHVTIAALRNMSANRLSTAIAIVSLSIGIMAALLMALVIRNQLTFGHFIPGYQRIYTAIFEITPPGRPTIYVDRSNRSTAALLKLNAPEIESSTRLMLADQNEITNNSVELKRGEIAAKETIYWADPNVFDVLPLPTVSGDLINALRRPDGIVLPRATALKYFGDENAIGQTIQLNNHPMTVEAVIDDLPANATDLQSGIFASGLASFSSFASDKDGQIGGFTGTVYTYFLLRPGASTAALEQKMPHFVDQLLSVTGAAPGGPHYAIQLLRLDQLPLFEGLHPGAKEKLAITGLVGVLILFIAAVNFVNLLTARAVRRALEVGIRKGCGATRSHLMVQFLGEAILSVLVATCIAASLSGLVTPTLNATLSTDASFDFWRDPALPITLLLGAMLLGVAAGAYPAFVLSAFRPISVLKGAMKYSPKASVARNVLVTIQFAILVGLAVAATVLYQQRAYATSEGLRADIDQMLVVRGPCVPAFRTEVRKLPGVAGVSCAGLEFLGTDPTQSPVTYMGQMVLLNTDKIDWGIFGLYGIKPLAGSLATKSHYGDYDKSAARGIVLNQAAVKRLGFASSEAAIGQSLPEPGVPPGSDLIRIDAVVPDFTFASVEQPIQPSAYVPGSLAHGVANISIKLKGQQIPETLAAIDRLWTETGQTAPINRFFLNDRMQQLYLGLRREAEIFAVFSGIAVLLACLGLLGLSISMTERRTKEIGIRKAMGASTSNVTWLLLWQFTKPVLWSNVIAWPIAWYAMTKWLAQFAYHVDLSVWNFVGATLLAIAVALATVLLQAISVARAVPVTALRYE